jgi:hypothetical protein
MTSTLAALRIFESEVDQIVDTVADSPDCETGGELIGLWSHADMPTVMLAGVTVMLAGTPAPKSVRTTTSFEQDPESHMELERLVWQDYGLQVVGLWHSHHQLTLHQLSGGDIRRTQGYSVRHQRPRYSEILTYLVQGERTSRRGEGSLGLDVVLRPYVYADAASGRALPTRIVTLPGESPLRAALRHERLGSDVQKVVEGAARRRRGRARYVLAESGPEVLDRGITTPADAQPDEAGRPAEDPATLEPASEPTVGDDAGRDEPLDDATDRADRPDVTDEQEHQRSGESHPLGSSSVPMRGEDDEPTWPVASLETAVANVVPERVARTLKMTVRRGRVEMSLDGDGGRTFVLVIEGDSPARGRVTAMRHGSRSPRELLMDNRKAAKVDFASLLVEAVDWLAYESGRYR